MTEYDPKDVSTWTDEQRRVAQEKAMEGWEDMGPVIGMNKEDMEAVLITMPWWTGE